MHHSSLCHIEQHTVFFVNSHLVVTSAECNDIVFVKEYVTCMYVYMYSIGASGAGTHKSEAVVRRESEHATEKKKEERERDIYTSIVPTFRAGPMYLPAFEMH